jgi:hypothetical protein
MRIKTGRNKIARLSDYFSFYFDKDNESDVSISILLFGTEYSIAFYRKESEWSSYIDDDFILAADLENKPQ